MVYVVHSGWYRVVCPLCPGMPWYVRPGVVCPGVGWYVRYALVCASWACAGLCLPAWPRGGMVLAWWCGACLVVLSPGLVVPGGVCLVAWWCLVAWSGWLMCESHIVHGNGMVMNTDIMDMPSVRPSDAP